MLFVNIDSEVGNKQGREPQGCQSIIQNITINKSLSISGQIFTKSALQYFCKKNIKKLEKGKVQTYLHLSCHLSWEYNWYNSLQEPKLKMFSILLIWKTKDDKCLHLLFFSVYAMCYVAGEYNNYKQENDLLD